MPVGRLTGFNITYLFDWIFKDWLVSICDCQLTLLSENAFLNNGPPDGKTFLYPVGTAVFDLDFFLVIM